MAANGDLASSKAVANAMAELSTLEKDFAAVELDARKSQACLCSYSCGTINRLTA